MYNCDWEISFSLYPCLQKCVGLVKPQPLLLKSEEGRPEAPLRQASEDDYEDTQKEFN
jgi:hypothetical protein